MSPLLSSAAGLGYEWGSYVWRGSGAWAQLWGMWALPFAWGLSWRAIARGRRLWLAALILGITICAHLLTGYLAMVSLAVFVLVAPRELRRGCCAQRWSPIGALLAAAWMLVPLLMDAGWTVNDEFSRGTFYYDSFGARRIMRWFVTGDLFDARRLPLLTGLLAVGLVVAVVQARRREPPRVVIGLGFVALLLFFGRPTLGPVIDLLPGGGGSVPPTIHQWGPPRGSLPDRPRRRLRRAPVRAPGPTLDPVPAPGRRLSPVWSPWCS